MKRYEQGSIGMRPDREGGWCDYYDVNKAVARAVEETIERCAKICEEFEVPDIIVGVHPDYVDGKRMMASQLAQAIRTQKG